MEEVSLIYLDAKSRLSTPTVPETCSQVPFYMDSQMGGDSSGQHPSPFMLQDT